MSIPKRTVLLAAALVLLLMPGAALAQAGGAKITTPTSGSTIGGVVSVLGSVTVDRLGSYSLTFGPGANPVQWIEISRGSGESIRAGRLALWDTTRIPDGLYTLRLRVVMGSASAAGYSYQDVYVASLLVANAPRTPTPLPTLAPTATPTETPLPTVTPTPLPTLDPEDGTSPYLYVTQVDLYDPLCQGWKQRYGIWVSNVGMVTVTNVILTDTLPLGCEPALVDSTSGARYDGARQVVWRLDSMAPGQAVKWELQVRVPTWLKLGDWLTNQVSVSCDQIALVESQETTLLSACPWLKETLTAVPVLLPTEEPTAAPTPTKTVVGAVGRPTLMPTRTPLQFTVPEEGIGKSLDALTLIIAVGLGILLVVTAVLVYQRVIRRR
jgi:hypothetical protein